MLTRIYSIRLSEFCEKFARLARSPVMCAMRLLFFLLTALLLVSQVSLVEAQQNFDGYEYIERVQRALLSLYPVDILKTLPKFAIGNSTSSSAARCNEQVELLDNSMRNGTMWALRMIDASSKIPSGILMGNRIDLGMYDECMNIREIENGEEIRGRHCTYNIKASFGGISMQETLSICLPSSCEPNDVKILLETELEKIHDSIGIEIPIEIIGINCSSLESSDWTAGGIATLVGFSVLLLFLVLSTICDVFVRNSGVDISSNSRLVLLTQFSIYSNAIRVLSTKTTPQTLPALQGIRFFSMCWVIFGHEYLMCLVFATVNTLTFFEWVHTWDALYIIIAPFSVDTFFTISGFLISYLFLKEMSTGRSFNIFAYYIHRYLRLTPALAALLLITIFIIPRAGSGALWESTINPMSDNCRHNWWPMLLYVHNYIDKEHLFCLAHTWYLAVEMHFFWISPLILYPLAKKPRIGLVILALAFIASVVTPAVISYNDKYTAATFAAGDLQLTARTTANFYMQSHLRAAPWLIGVFFGYLVFVQKGSPGKMTKWIGWVLAIAAFAFCFFSIKVFQAKGYVYDIGWETFYVVVSKPFWSGAVAWIIYASVCGFGGPITTLLSFPIYHPFSRISYCVYLVHFVIQIMRVSAARTPRYFSEITCFNEFLTDFSLSVIIGFFSTLILESPILTLEKIIRRRGRRKLSESKQELRHEKSENGIDNPGMMKD